MKRAAGYQGRRGEDEAPEEEEDLGNIPRRADQEELSKRPMKGLPNRKRVNPGAATSFPASTSAAPLINTPTLAEDENVPFLTSVRALNKSFLNHLESSIKTDPFSDLGPLFEQYRDWRCKALVESRENTEASIPPDSQPTEVPSKVERLTMPAPPAAFKFGDKTTTPASTFGAFGGTTFSSFGSSSAGPLFPSFKPPGESSKTKEATSTETTIPAPFASTKSSVFPTTGAWAPPDKPSTEATAEKPAELFKTGGSSASTSNGLFTMGGASSSTPTASSPAAPFSFSGTNPWAKKKPEESPSKAAADDKAAVPGAALFGGAARATGGTFSFSSSSTSKPAATGFTFGATPSPGGSLGNPVGFSFGGSTGPSAADQPPATEESAATPKAAPRENTSDSSTIIPPPPDLTASREETPASESGLVDDDNAVFPGEEDETNLFVLRCRISKLDKKENKFGALGVGKIKLKKHNETGKVRLVHREEGLQRVLLNVYIFKALKPSAAGKAVRLNLIEGGEIVTYSLRAPTDAEANELKAAIDEEVAKLP